MFKSYSQKVFASIVFIADTLSVYQLFKTCLSMDFVVIISNKWFWTAILITLGYLIYTIVYFFFEWRNNIEIRIYENNVRIRFLNAIISYNQSNNRIGHVTKNYLEAAGLAPQDLLLIGFSQRQIDDIVSMDDNSKI